MSLYKLIDFILKFAKKFALPLISLEFLFNLYVASLEFSQLKTRIISDLKKCIYT